MYIYIYIDSLYHICISICGKHCNDYICNIVICVYICIYIYMLYSVEYISTLKVCMSISF